MLSLLLSLKKFKLTTVQMIVSIYFLAVAISTLLLSLPFLYKEGVEISFIDTLFTAVSAISVTGLTVVNTSETFNTLGIFVLALILQVGGVGVMALGTMIWLIFGRKIGLKERKLIMTDQNRTNLSGLVALMRDVMTLMLLFELIGTIILGTYFLIRYYPNPAEAYYQGFFASVSATTNAGFDITGSSLIPFAHDFFVQGICMILIVLGAIGFPVLIEVKEFLSGKYTRYHFSLFTKITTVTFFLLIIICAVFILVSEYDHFLADKSWQEKIGYSLFQSVTTRSAGLVTMNVNDFSTPTLLFLSLMMFIGASPSSVGGGIRTTTLALILLGTFAYARGKQRVKVFNRELYPEDIMKAYVVTTVAAIITILGVFMLASTEQFPLVAIIFEVCSAFGTTGLSLGITPQLDPFGKIMLMVIMFIGRIGIPSFLFILREEAETERFHYPKERMIIG